MIHLWNQIGTEYVIVYCGAFPHLRYFWVFIFKTCPLLLFPILKCCRHQPLYPVWVGLLLLASFTESFSPSTKVFWGKPCNLSVSLLISYFTRILVPSCSAKQLLVQVLFLWQGPGEPEESRSETRRYPRRSMPHPGQRLTQDVQ